MVSSSSPVASTATTGRRMTLTLSMPREAITPTSAALMTVPFSSTNMPVLTSSPAGRTLQPKGISAKIATWSRDFPSSFRSTSSVSSNGITVSAPSGSGAPVMIRIAVPETTVLSGIEPAATIPITDRLMGVSFVAPEMSLCRTA